MAYEFFSKDGVDYVRINVGIDTVERAATKEDHEVAESVNAAEKAAAEALEAATKERQERERANEQLALGLAPAAPASSQKEIEQEFDAGLAHELEEDKGNNGKHKKKHA